MQGHPAYQNTEADREIYKRIRTELESALARIENAQRGALHLNGVNRFLPIYLEDAARNLASALRTVDRRLDGTVPILGTRDND